VRRLVCLASTVALLALATAASANHNVIERASTGPAESGGTAFGVLFQQWGAVSADGSHVAFTTNRRLVSADTDDDYDLYVRANGVTELVGPGQFKAMSRDGSRIFFLTSEALVPEDTDGGGDFYEYSGGTVRLVSTGPNDLNAGNSFGSLETRELHITPDGLHAFFMTDEQLVAADTDNRYDIYERSGNTTRLVTPGTASDALLPGFHTLPGLERRNFSDDGSHVYFSTIDSLVPSDVDNCSTGCLDVYEVTNGVYRLVSVGPTGLHGTYSFDGFHGTTPDGSRALFTSARRLTPDDTDDLPDIYENRNGVATLISTGPLDSQTDAASFAGASEDGTHVFFRTPGALTADDTDTSSCQIHPDYCWDIYERSGDATSLVSTGPTDPQSGPSPSYLAGLSLDGTRAFFMSSLRLTSDDTDPYTDLYERSNGTTTRLTPPVGSQYAGVGSSQVRVSASGDRVFFTSGGRLTAEDVDSGCFYSDEGGPPQAVPCIDIYERHAGTYTLISDGPVGGSGGFHAELGDVSDDGHVVAFTTNEQLTADDTNSATDVYAARVGYPRPTYEVPQGAGQLSASFVPTFRPCGTGANPADGQHAPPLSVRSCLPPITGSVVAHLGSSASGSATFTVQPGDGDPGNGDQSDVGIAVALSDIRATGGGDYNPNASGPDLTEITRLRITDMANGASQTGAGTTSDYDFRVPVDCSSTPDPSVGASCNATTSADTVIPGMAQEGKAALLAAFRIRLDDSGANGVRGDSDDRIFATQGIYVP
jgi:hypothetical protein